MSLNEQESAPVLLELVGSVALPGGQILVPGCGSGHDVMSLAAPESVVTGIDRSESAAAAFEALRVERGVPRSFVRFMHADLFGWQADRSFDLIWDAAFLATVEAAERPRWANRVSQLLVPGGELAVLVCPVDVIVPQELDTLLAGDFHREVLRPVERSHPGRQGREWLGRWRKR